jgi:hypothetical protein
MISGIFCAQANDMGGTLMAHYRLGAGKGQDRDEEPRLEHAPPLPVAPQQPQPGVKSGRPRTQIMRRSVKNNPEPKVREAKLAAHDQTRSNNPSADAFRRASGDTNCSMLAKTVNNRDALKKIGSTSLSGRGTFSPKIAKKSR